MAYNTVADIYEQWHSPAARQFYLDDLQASQQQPVQQPQMSDMDELNLRQAQMEYDRQNTNPWQNSTYPQMTADRNSPAYESIDPATGTRALPKISVAAAPTAADWHAPMARPENTIPDPIGDQTWPDTLNRQLITGPRQEAMMADTKSAAVADPSTKIDTRGVNAATAMYKGALEGRKAVAESMAYLVARNKDPQAAAEMLKPFDDQIATYQPMLKQYAQGPVAGGVINPTQGTSVSVQPADSVGGDTLEGKTLTPADSAAYRTAHQARDKATANAIRKKYGLGAI